MDLKQLQELGAFVPNQPVRMDLTCTLTDDDGSNERTVNFTARIKVLSGGDNERMWAAIQKRKDPSNIAAIVSSACLRDEEGNQCITYEEADRFKQSLLMCLFEAVQKVNPPYQKKPEDEAAKN